MSNDTPATPVLPGKLRQGTLAGKQFEPGTHFDYNAYLPRHADKNALQACYLMLECTPQGCCPVLERLMEEGLIPFGVIVMTGPGTLVPPAKAPETARRWMRAEEFDQYGREYSDFLVEELLPEIASALEIAWNPSPDFRCVCGGSSGGMAAWNMVWFRNDAFRRAFLCSPTFSAIRGGEEPMVLLRKTETRPIRTYVTCGTIEPDSFFGNSYYAACNAADAMELSGYDFRFERFPGEGHGYGFGLPEVLRRAMTFLWANWRTDPVRTLGNPLRVNLLVQPNAPWTPTDQPFPDHPALSVQGFQYTFDRHRIYVQSSGETEKRVAAEGFDSLTGMIFSSDLWRVYVADAARRFVYAWTRMPDGTLSQAYRLAPLHLAHDCRLLGARDLCLDTHDRVYAATELGIQAITSFGMVDAILPLPQALPADRVAFGGEHHNLLFAAAGTRVFCRPMKTAGVNYAAPHPPSTPNYDDGFNYSRHNAD